MKLNTCAVALLAMASLATAALAPAAAADVPDGKRVPHTTETQSTGKPTNPRGWGSITSQRARNEGDIGTHVSAQEKPHQGVGNVARNDQDVADALGTPNTGSHVSNHADTVGPVVGYDPNVRPGTKEEEEETTAAHSPSTLAAVTDAPTTLATPEAKDPSVATTSAPSPSTLAAVTDAPTTLATPEANDPSVDLGPLGIFSFSNSFTSLTDYSYTYGLSGGPVEYSVQSQGSDAGVTGFSSYSAGGFSTSTESQYGTSYDGSSCVLCQENTTGFDDFFQITEFNVLADGTVEYEGSGPLGSYSWPPE